MKAEDIKTEVRVHCNTWAGQPLLPARMSLCEGSHKVESVPRKNSALCVRVAGDHGSFGVFLGDEARPGCQRDKSIRVLVNCGCSHEQGEDVHQPARPRGVRNNRESAKEQLRGE